MGEFRFVTFFRFFIIRLADYIPASRKFSNSQMDGCPIPCIINSVNIPDRIVTEMELRRNTGERGTRKFIAHKGIVYDVTDCPKWRLELHEQLHFPGQDLTSELPDAPHEEDVFSRPCVKVIGKLENPDCNVS